MNSKVSEILSDEEELGVNPTPEVLTGEAVPEPALERELTVKAFSSATFPTLLVAGYLWLTV